MKLLKINEYIAENNNMNLKKGDLVMYKYNHTTNHPLGGKQVTMIVRILDIIERGTGTYAEISINGKLITVKIDVLVKADSKYKEGQEIDVTPDYNIDDMQHLKYK